MELHVLSPTLANQGLIHDLICSFGPPQECESEITCAALVR